MEYAIVDGLNQPIKPGDKLLSMTHRGPRVSVVNSIDLRQTKEGVRMIGMDVTVYAGNRKFISTIRNLQRYVKVGDSHSDNLSVPGILGDQVMEKVNSYPQAYAHA